MAKSAPKTKAKKPAPRQSKLAVTASPKKSAPIGIAIGSKVKHRLFGIGKVIARRDDILSIQFDMKTTKDILVDFVVPA
ncbi:MAG: hypothetical protein ABL907_24055 [Hyphomicrobium sp.]